MKKQTAAQNKAELRQDEKALHDEKKALEIELEDWNNADEAISELEDAIALLAYDGDRSYGSTIMHLVDKLEEEVENRKEALDKLQKLGVRDENHAKQLAAEMIVDIAAV